MHLCAQFAKQITLAEAPLDGADIAFEEARVGLHQLMRLVAPDDTMLIGPAHEA